MMHLNAQWKQLFLPQLHVWYLTLESQNVPDPRDAFHPSLSWQRLEDYG